MCVCVLEGYHVVCHHVGQEKAQQSLLVKRREEVFLGQHEPDDTGWVPYADISNQQQRASSGYHLAMSLLKNYMYTKSSSFMFYIKQ